MLDDLEAISAARVALPKTTLIRMVRLVRALFRMSRQDRYREYLLPLLPDAARFDPGHDAVMMGYDFHVQEGHPRLIEVNTNAGGGLLAYRASRPDFKALQDRLPSRLQGHLLGSFSREMEAYSGGLQQKPQRIAILDENPREQFLYPEMLAFQRLFSLWGVPAVIVDPAELDADAGGVFHQGLPVDFIYNRHCDFYLQGRELEGIRQAYLSSRVCLSPNPFAYGLLADKRRMALWTDRRQLEALGLPSRDVERILQDVPQSRMLDQMDLLQVWEERKDWVFKPVDRYGSRGVLLGRKISRSRFDQLPPEQTLVQRLIEPSLTPCGQEVLKTDFRLYVYRNRILGVAARLYQGQVTNLRTPGGGFAPVDVR